MLDIISEAGLSNSVKVPWAFFEIKPSFQGARLEPFPFSSSKNLASCLSVQMYFCLGFYTVWLRSSHGFLLSGWAEEWQFMKSEDVGCLAQKHSQMNLGTRKGCTLGPPWPIAGAGSLVPTFENPNGKTVLKLSATWGCMGDINGMERIPIISGGPLIRLA